MKNQLGEYLLYNRAWIKRETRKCQIILGKTFSKRTIAGLRERFIGSHGIFDKGDMLKTKLTYRRVPVPKDWIIDPHIQRERQHRKPKIHGVNASNRKISVFDKRQKKKSSVVKIVKGENFWLTHHGRVFSKNGEALVECWHRQENAKKHMIPMLLHGTPVVDTPLNRDSIPIFENVVSVTQSNDAAYGHFISEVIPRLNLAERYCGNDALVYTSNRYAQYEEALEIVGCKKDRIVSSDVFPLIGAKRATIPVFRPTPGYVYPTEFIDVFNTIKKRVLGSEISDETGGSRIYISRKYLNKSRIASEDEFIEFLVEKGFDVVYPESLSFADQVRTFHNADVVLGPHGSGMFSCVFCRPGTRVIDIQPESINSSLFLVMSSFDIDYRIVTSITGHIKWAGKRSFSVPFDEVTRALESS